jgi:CofD-related protein of GAK system
MKQTVKDCSEIKFLKVYKVPDRYAVVRCLKAPEAGPKILFFSGGTALKKLSRALINYTHNSIHIITPFDSGGSSAEIRKAFKMLSVGDIRNRIMSLADRTIQGNPDIYRLFAYRLDKNIQNPVLKAELAAMIEGRHELVSAIPDPMRKIIRNYLKFFYVKMPQDFNLKGANIGNLILTAGYLNSSEHIDPVIFIFSKLVEARATVRPVTSRYLELAAELKDGRTIVGQHLLTAKEAEPVNSQIINLFLTDGCPPGNGSSGKINYVDVSIRKKVADLINNADLICYPMGSFYSSIIANFLVKGVGQAISENPCMKVYIPNTGTDPEQYGMSVSDCIENIIKYLSLSCRKKTLTEKLLNYVIIDSKNGAYTSMGDIGKFKDIKIIDTSLVADKSLQEIDENRLSEVLVSLA